MKTRLIYVEKEKKVKVRDLLSGKGAIRNFNNLGLVVGNEYKVKSSPKLKGKIILEDDNSQNYEIGFELASKVIVEVSEPNNFHLDLARVGDKVKIEKINAKGEIRRRLMDMGLIKGTEFEVLRRAPLGDPIEIKLSGFDLTLRLEEAETIEVKLIKLNNKKEKKFLFFG